MHVIRAMIKKVGSRNVFVPRKGRPGGNPDISKYAFKQKYQWSQSCTETLAFRVPPAMKSAVKSEELDWQEICRHAIADALKEKGIEIK